MTRILIALLRVLKIPVYLLILLSRFRALLSLVIFLIFLPIRKLRMSLWRLIMRLTLSRLKSVNDSEMIRPPISISFRILRKEVMNMLKPLALESLTSLLTILLKYLPDLLKVEVKK